MLNAMVEEDAERPPCRIDVRRWSTGGADVAHRLGIAVDRVQALDIAFGEWSQPKPFRLDPHRHAFSHRRAFVSVR